MKIFLDIFILIELILTIYTPDESLDNGIIVNDESPFCCNRGVPLIEYIVMR